MYSLSVRPNWPRTWQALQREKRLIMISCVEDWALPPDNDITGLHTNCPATRQSTAVPSCIIRRYTGQESYASTGRKIFQTSLFDSRNPKVRSTKQNHWKEKPNCVRWPRTVEPISETFELKYVCNSIGRGIPDGRSLAIPTYTWHAQQVMRPGHYVAHYLTCRGWNLIMTSPRCRRKDDNIVSGTIIEHRYKNIWHDLNILVNKSVYHVSNGRHICMQRSECVYRWAHLECALQYDPKLNSK